MADAGIGIAETLWLIAPRVCDILSVISRAGPSMSLHTSRGRRTEKRWASCAMMGERKVRPKYQSRERKGSSPSCRRVVWCVVYEMSCNLRFVPAMMMIIEVMRAEVNNGIMPLLCTEARLGRTSKQGFHLRAKAAKSHASAFAPGSIIFRTDAIVTQPSLTKNILSVLSTTV